MYVWLLLLPWVLITIGRVLSVFDGEPLPLRIGLLMIAAIVTGGITNGCCEEMLKLPSKVTGKVTLMVIINTILCLCVPGSEPAYAIAIPAGVLNVGVFLYVIAHNG